MKSVVDKIINLCIPFRRNDDSASGEPDEERISRSAGASCLARFHIDVEFGCPISLQ